MSTITTKPKAIFTGGPGGAGKSKVVHTLFPNVSVIDPDAIKQTIPGYNPKLPHFVHTESVALADAAHAQALAARQSFVRDGTGSNLLKYADWLKEAQAHGFEVHYLFVSAPLYVCQQRNLKRARTVPAAVIEQAHRDSHANYATLAALATSAAFILNA